MMNAMRDAKVKLIKSYFSQSVIFLINIILSEYGKVNSVLPRIW